jgi:flagellar biosynthesis activator protein FlaF
MQSAAQAYGSVARKIASPRELEADLLLKAAARMQAVYDNWDASRTTLSDALTYNRKLWTIFVTSVTETDSPLPVEIRQNIANIGMFVVAQTMKLMTDPQQRALPALININREIAAGLRGSA